MASGIQRSKFIRPMADALEWTTAKLRTLFESKDYHAPFTDLPRALRILQQYAPDKMSVVLEALRLHVPEEMTGMTDPGGSPQLALMPPAVPKLSAPTPSVAVPPGAQKGLVGRLVQMIPGDGSFTEKRAKVRAVLKKHRVDGRMKDEALAVGWIKEAFPDANPLPQSDTTAVVQITADIETLPAEQSPHTIRSLVTQLSERESQLKALRVRVGEIKYLLDAAKSAMVDSGLGGVHEETAGFIFLAVATAKKPL